MRRGRAMPAAAMTAALVVLATALGAAPVSAAATVRYASPSGGGTACTAGSPCSLETALFNAAKGNIVDIRGDQGEYTIATDLVARSGITVRGSHGTPTIDVGGGSLLFASSKVSNLHIRGFSYSSVFYLDKGTGDRIWAENGGEGHTCFIGHRTTLKNSVCRAHTQGDTAIETMNTATLRNVTAYGGTNAAIHAVGRSSRCGGCTKATLTMVNTIAKAGVGGKDLRIESEGSTAITARPTTSNYRTVLLQGPKSKRKLVPSKTNQTKASQAPRFINALQGNLRAAAGSPTIDKGVTARANGTKDVDGRARKVGRSTDIGGPEYSPPQTKITGGPSGTVNGVPEAFTFSATPASGATFECKQDGDPYAVCSSPSTPTWGTGAHTFRVRAIDSLGYVDPTPAKRTFTVAP